MPSVRPQHTMETWLSREQIHSGDTCTSHVRGNELCVNGFWVPPTQTAPPAACEASPRCLPSFPVKMHMNWILWCCCSPTLLFLWWPYLALYCTSLQRNHGTETHLVIVPQNITHQPTQSTTTKTRNPPWWLATDVINVFVTLRVTCLHVTTGCKKSNTTCFCIWRTKDTAFLSPFPPSLHHHIS